MSESCCIITTTVESDGEASTIAKLAISKQLAACVQIIPGITSYYEWQGQIEKSQELMLQFKTTRACSKKLMSHIKASHRYETPEIIMTRIGDVDPDYQKWLETVTNKDTSL